MVGGNVIGSVLVAGAHAISANLRAQLRVAVAQTAPILANQRNLSLAESQARHRRRHRPAEPPLGHGNPESDGGAGRTVGTPLTAVLLDLDHFKDLNDLHGHEQGDYALAEVGAVLTGVIGPATSPPGSAVRSSCCCFPKPTACREELVAEKVRAAIAAIEGTFGPADGQSRPGLHPAGHRRPRKRRRAWPTGQCMWRSAAAATGLRRRATPLRPPVTAPVRRATRPCFGPRDQPALPPRLKL